ncbi:MAG: cysteine--1-D-myo-inosityl 2-amino-2-deoxy-alpha-D-glucopyranoside ligase [Actinomycetota bacterium]|nr:cysteine--1-D-myo-inosityl 2-amino-2-deoxy-alpha-D-glucopyranoside ligase [Actinomycetota bacterium]
MESWSAPMPRALRGKGKPLALFDTSTGVVRPTAPAPHATMYVCGITPYDATHIGHANTYVAFDMINRVWRDAGHQVRYVQNVTDIDDPLLERAVATGENWREIADRETDLFRDDMAGLNVLPPDHYIGAVESIPSVARKVMQLQESGDVYAVGDDLYFRVRNDERFGSIAGLDEHDMVAVFAERGGDPERAGKEHPLDCLVWQNARPEEPAWDTPLGHGRPGWHIECAAIALDYLGPTIDIQGGGSDLAFPHHEMGASEVHRLTGEWPFARHYVHSGMVAWQGHKMSKSRGNLVFVSQLVREGIDPMAILLALLGHHYRTDWVWTPHGLEGARERLQRWIAASQLPYGPPVDPLIDRVREVLADDLRTPSALDAVDSWVYTALTRGGQDPTSPGELATVVDTLLGIRLT